MRLTPTILTPLRLIVGALLLAGAVVVVLVPSVETLTDADHSGWQIAPVYRSRAEAAPATAAERAFVVARARAVRLALVQRAHEAAEAARSAFDTPASRGRPATEIVYRPGFALPVAVGGSAVAARAGAYLPSLPAMLAVLGDSIAKLGQRAARGSPGPTRVALIGRKPADLALGTAFNPDGSRLNGWVLLPDALGAGRCAVTFGPRQTTYLDYRNPVGPCAWFAAFGPPGSGTKAWLDSTNYGAAVNFTGRTSSKSSQFHRFDESMTLLQKERAVMRSYAYEGDVQWVACLAGRSGACASLALARRPSGFYFGMLTGPLPGYLQYWRFVYGSPVTGSFFASVLDDFGAERTAMIWRSEKPIEQAFLEATGEPFDLYLHRAVTAYEGLRYRPGPWLRFGSLLALLALCGGLGAAALRWGQRPEAAKPGAALAK